MFRKSVNNSDSYRLSFWEYDLKEYVFSFFRKELLFDKAQIIFYIAGTPSPVSVLVTTKYLIVFYFLVKNAIIEF